MSWYRIEKPAVGAHLKMAAAPPAPQPDDFKAYMQRLLRLIPAEVITLYLTFRGLADPHSKFAYWWSAICLVLVVVLRIFGTRATGGSIWTFQKIAVGVAAVSFILWVYGMGDTILGFAIGEPIWINASIAIWTIVVPLFYKGD